MQYQMQAMDPAAAAMQPMAPQQAAYAAGAAATGAMTSVVLVNHLEPSRVNLEILFNLFTTCGIVHRIKILFHQRHTALVQYAVPNQAHTARTVLSGTPLHGRQLLVTPSKHLTLTGRPDGENQVCAHQHTRTRHLRQGLFADYTGSVFQRFKGPQSRIQPAPASSLLHVSNISSAATAQDIITAFQGQGTVKEVKFIQPKQGSTGDRQMALVQMDTVENAVEILCLKHNEPIGDSRIRISFSNSHLA